MKDFSIKIKLIVLFVLIKVIPLLIITIIAYKGAIKLEEYLQDSTRFLFNKSKEIILNTANESIEDSIKNLDKKSQLSVERLSFNIANNVANFLYERDKDILFLSKLDINQDILTHFYNSKNKEIIKHEKYIYNENTNKWESSKKPTKIREEVLSATLKDNEKEFNYTNPLVLEKESIPIYKEVVFFDLKGMEKFKVSQINNKLLNISKKSNTYINSENYFKEIQKLNKGDIYVSNVIGEQLKTKVIGTFTKAKAKKANIEFEPENYAYAGKENPVGKEFEGIIRFITPVYKNGVKTGFISLALDHKHIMQFTDTVNPTSSIQTVNISDASVGNYAFMWDYLGKNISHPRDYFIAGYDKNTGEEAMPWLSKDIADKFKASNKNINEFLKEYPTYEEQSLSKKPNIAQLKKDGNIGLDCRYLNFAPQCEGWMQVTQDGGYGSFIIYWSKVWKLSTAATIPYYTGQYSNTKRGFGIITIGANVEEFHSAANETRRNVKNILSSQTEHMKEIVNENTFEVEEFIAALINELSILTLIMVILMIAIAIWMSNYITSKIENLIKGTQEFSQNNFEYKIKVTSKDEIGKLEKSFNKMALKIKKLLNEQKLLNEHLEEKVNEKTEELKSINLNLEKQIEERTEHLENALIKVRNADKAKSTFLANMSHEIRTPLNAIIGFSEILSDSKHLDIHGVKQARIINSSANSLLSIINDILDISKIENGNFDLNLDKTDLYFISEHVVELFSSKATEKHIKLVFNLDHKIPMCVLSDGVRIRQVLSNLLSNAIKFTPEHGKVQVSINMIETTNGKSIVRFEVLDTGIGIPKNKLDNIFKPFMQVDHQSNREFEGTGLGLSISTHIIELLGSKINITSEVGNGSRFWFDLTFDVCNDSIHTNKEYLHHLNFIISDNSSDLYHYIKRYLNIFGSIDASDSNSTDILICSSISKTQKEIETFRTNNCNKPVLVLFEYEEQVKKFKAKENEYALSLPFYASKVNDALQELQKKAGDNLTTIKRNETDKFIGNVLVAEDNTANQELISYVLESLGVNYTIEANGLDTLNTFKKEQFDIILMDINMPVMDGIEALKNIRAYEKENALGTIPIIALTANAVKGDRERFLEVGMNEYLSKPINTSELIHLFRKFLKEANENTKKEDISIEINKELQDKNNYSIDIKKVVNKLGISENIAEMIINKFKKDIQKDIEELETFIRENNNNQIASKAHYIKNSCLNVALDEACNILQELENKNLNPSKKEELFNKLKVISNSIIQE